MRIEIFVVETKLEAMKTTLLQNQARKEAYLALFHTKNDLVKLFGGLTELDFKGYWKRQNTILGRESVGITTDFGKLWLIYTYGDKQAIIDGLQPILRRIKALTQQQVMCYAVNNDLLRV